MLCKDVIAVLESAYPTGCAPKWDNVGFLAGRTDKEVRCVYVALDASDEVIDAAVKEKADMLITHHPLIFSGLKHVTDQDFIGRRILQLLQYDISYYAMHTNYDIKSMGRLAAQRLCMKDAQVLEVTGVCEDGKEEGIGRIADIEPISLLKFCEQIKKIFELDCVQVFGNLNETVRRVAICPGSGKSVIEIALEKGADVLITGDIGHHEGIDAVAQQMAVIDAGHYGIEHIFIEDVKRYLEENIRTVEIKAAPVSHPFVVL